MITLLQVMTADSWVTGLARPLGKEYPGIQVFFIIFYIMTAFGILNFLTALFVGVLVLAPHSC